MHIAKSTINLRRKNNISKIYNNLQCFDKLNNLIHFFLYLSLFVFILYYFTIVFTNFPICLRLLQQYASLVNDNERIIWDAGLERSPGRIFDYTYVGRD